MSFERQFMIVIDPDHLFNSTRKGAPTPDQYINETRKIIQNISTSETGKIVLNTIKLWNKLVRIAPTPDVPGMCMGADAVQGELKDWQWNKAIRPTLDLIGIQVAPVRAVIHFEPGTWSSGGACHTRHTDKLVSDFTPSLEEVLFHELVHSVRWVSDTLKLGPHATFGLAHYDNPEEFIAVVVTNIFQSERKGNLRQGHTGFKTLDQQLSDSFKFYQSSSLAFDYMDRFCKSNPHFTKRLCKVNVSFNPVHAYYHDQNKCREMSKSAPAVVRDAAGILKAVTPWSQNVWKRVLMIP